MSNAGVYHPSQGLGQSMDTFRPRVSSKPPSRSGSRPGTQGSARFGGLSHSSFFARHNPHPGRVRHIKGKPRSNQRTPNKQVFTYSTNYTMVLKSQTGFVWSITRFVNSFVSFVLRLIHKIS